MMRTSLSVAAVLLVIAAPLPADAKHLRFAGPHPIAAALGGGWCYIEGPHLHAYLPDHNALYSRTPAGLVFAADPTPFGYEGPRYTFYGEHPVPDEPDVYCYLTGPHTHWYAPPPDGYRVQRGVAFYVGPWSPVYERERPQRVRSWEAAYRPYAAMRPVVEVEPPPEWHGVIWAPPAPVVTVSAPLPPAVQLNVPPPPHVVFGAPSPPSVEVDVAPPPPIRVRMPPPPHMVVGVPPPPHVVLGFPPPPRVRIEAPAPPGIYVGVSAPRPPHAVVIAGPQPVYREERYHHDNGRHEGWYRGGGKHGHGGHGGRHDD